MARHALPERRRRILEGDIYTDLNEARLVGSTDDVVIVSQFDRFDGAFDGDGDWTTTKRYLVTQDDDLATVNSEELKISAGSIAAPRKRWPTSWSQAITSFPAKKYALILSDHGAGWMGGWNDNDPVEGEPLSINEIDQALAYAIAETGIEQFEFIGFDACLMSQVEALSGVAPYARYSVASEETEPAIGWAYSRFLTKLAAKPTMNGATLARTSSSPHQDDVRIRTTTPAPCTSRDNYGFEGECRRKNWRNRRSGRHVDGRRRPQRSCRRSWRLSTNLLMPWPLSTRRRWPRRAPTPSPSRTSSVREIAVALPGPGQLRQTGRRVCRIGRSERRGQESGEGL